MLEKSLLAASFMLISCLAYSLIPKMEATCVSASSVDFQRTTRGYIAEDRNLQATFDLVCLFSFLMKGRYPVARWPHGVCNPSGADACMFVDNVAVRKSQ
jgi:hypothetical protein